MKRVSSDSHIFYDGWLKHPDAFTHAYLQKYLFSTELFVYIEKINYAVGDGYRLKSEALKYCTSLSAMFRSTNDLEPFAEKFCRKLMV